MKLPFKLDDFLQVFRNYNTAVFPIQIIFYCLAIIAVFLSFKKNQYSDRIISSALSFFWLWMGVIYHIIYFSSINKAAYFFGIVFIIQGLLFLWKGVYQKNLHFSFYPDINGIMGSLLILFALVFYPIISYLAGHAYPVTPTFGLPCPTTIFSFGILLFLKEKYSLWLLVIPFLWSLIGFSAAFSLGMKEDTGLIIASILSCILLIRKKLMHEKN